MALGCSMKGNTQGHVLLLNLWSWHSHGCYFDILAWATYANTCCTLVQQNNVQNWIEEHEKNLRCWPGFQSQSSFVFRSQCLLIKEEQVWPMEGAPHNSQVLAAKLLMFWSQITQVLWSSCFNGSELFCQHKQKLQNVRRIIFCYGWVV